MICIYIVNEHPFYMRMCANSISMLRQHNMQVPIRLYLIEDNCEETWQRKGMIPVEFDKTDFLKVCVLENVEVIKKPPLEHEKGFFHQNRSYFQEIPEEDVFFIDSDTFIFGDVEKLAERYTADLSASESRWMTQQGWDSEKYVQKALRPFNSGVVVWRRGWCQKWAKWLPDALESLKTADHKANEYLRQSTRNLGGREEVSLTVFAAENDLEVSYFDQKDVHLIETQKDIDEVGKSAIFHSYTDQWGEVFNNMEK